MNEPEPVISARRLDVDYGLHRILMARSWKPTNPYAVESEIAELILYAEERRPGITDRG